LDPLQTELNPTSETVFLRQPPLVGVCASGGAFGDDRGDPGIGPDGTDCFLTAHRHPDDRDLAGVELRLSGEEVDARSNVEVAEPAELHGPALAATVAAGVGDQQAKSVTCQNTSLG
jgi:hypothetical protein